MPGAYSSANILGARVNALTITPRQAFEVARLLDRTGDGIIYALDGVVTVLVDVFGVGSRTSRWSSTRTAR